MGEVRVYKLIKGDGSSGFMCPPGHWNHRWSLHEYPTARSRNPIGIGTIGQALEADSGATDAMRNRVQRIMDESTLVCSELWVRQVYGYFKGCYAPDETTTRDVSKMISFSALRTEYILAANLPRDATSEQRDEVRAQAAERAAADIAAVPADRHLAVMCVREYFPDHEPRLDLIADPGKGYGSYPCAKCGKRVQYEPRVDALAVFGVAGGEKCAEGGAHEYGEN